MEVGQTVILSEDDDSIIPGGVYRVSSVNSDGSFHVGGNTAVWPTRVITSRLERNIATLKCKVGSQERVGETEEVC